eukprot:CFRG6077T1
MVYSALKYVVSAATLYLVSSSNAVVLTAKEGFEGVTCGSAVKLMNVQAKVYLHSHEVSYGTGSKQQSVTAVQQRDDMNSLWVVRGEASNPCKVGKPVKCGGKVRLTHAQTNKNLHSHLHRSPLSRQQEISAYGIDGEGDEGDVWYVVCNTDNWMRGTQFSLKHVQTNTYVSTNKDYGFGRPIEGQYEVAARTQKDNQCNWVVKLGVFMKDGDL